MSSAIHHPRSPGWRWIGVAALLVVAAALAGWVIWGRDSGADSASPSTASVVPVSSGGLHDPSPQAVDAARGGIEVSAAGKFETLGAPPGVVPEAGVGARTGRAPKAPAGQSAPARYLADDVGLAARRALNAVSSTIQLAPKAFPGFKTPCSHITPMLTSVSGPQMAGEFNDGEGGCYVWLNLLNIADIPASDLCKLALHELGHLSGLQHSKDQADVMYSPFVSKPVPPACTGRASAAGK